MTFHLPRHASGRVVGVILPPGNWDEHDAGPLLAQVTEGGVVSGGMGYCGAERRNLCQAGAISL